MLLKIPKPTVISLLDRVLDLVFHRPVETDRFVGDDVGDKVERNDQPKHDDQTAKESTRALPSTELGQDPLVSGSKRIPNTAAIVISRIKPPIMS